MSILAASRNISASNVPANVPSLRTFATSSRHTTRRNLNDAGAPLVLIEDAVIPFDGLAEHVIVKNVVRRRQLARNVTQQTLADELKRRLHRVEDAIEPLVQEIRR